ncbi:MAG: hypothetical protein KAS67_01265 [Thermoplasmata archaeon]|nr:hypothetical protein [Thermoplasmata archaeon]
MSREKLMITEDRLKMVNDFLMDPSNPLVNDLLAVIDKYGGVDEINRKAAEAGKVETLINKLDAKGSPMVKDLDWLMDQRDNNAFISYDDYKKKILGDRYGQVQFNDDIAVTLEISALQYFPFLMKQAEQAIANQELMPGRFIRVRFMKEQEEDLDLLAVQAAMRIIDSSVCETLDTKGTDGSNIHLGGPDTITGYFGGVGQPNTHPIKWVDEYLYYYTNFGVQQVLNINPGTVFVAYMLHKLGVNNEFKISVFMGNDNPYAIFWTLMAANLFKRDDGTTPLIGFNFSNSVNNQTIEISAKIRKAFDLDDIVRFEHHITETYKSIVIQPYDRREELMDIAKTVPNISAKHEGGIPEIDKAREHPSNILEYFLPRADVDSQGLMPALTQNYLDKHDALNSSAKMLTERGISVIAAKNLHHR